MNAPRRAGIALALAAVLAGTVGSASAQEPTEIGIGSTVSGTLTSSDPALLDRGPARVYSFQAEEGQFLVAVLRSGAFDAYLTLMRTVSGVTDVVDSDDDSGGGSDARLRFRVPATGVYYLVAQGYSAEDTGGYSLTLDVAAPARPATPQPLRMGETRDGTLMADGPILFDGNADLPYHLYTLEAQAGQQLVIGLDSDDFDAFLAFGPMVGDMVEVTATDDDGGGGSDARLRVSIPRDGTYGIHARPLSAGGTGAYTITVREAMAVAPRPVAAGQVVQGMLGEGDPDEDQKFFEDWIYQGAAGETLRIWLSSEDFDAYLTVGHTAEGAYQELDWNDDGEEMGTDSYLEITIPADGEYLIRATSWGSGSTGRYTLRVEAAGG
jgi:hypothetical protein